MVNPPDISCDTPEYPGNDKLKLYIYIMYSGMSVIELY